MGNTLPQKLLYIYVLKQTTYRCIRFMLNDDIRISQPKRRLTIFFRELFSSSGACAATKRGMEALLGRPGGVLSVLVVGGAPESLNRLPFSSRDK